MPTDICVAAPVYGETGALGDEGTGMVLLFGLPAAAGATGEAAGAIGEAGEPAAAATLAADG